jgi:predicted Zn-dependent protease
MALTAAQRPAEGSKRFRDALAVNPRYAPALRGLAMNYMSAGDTANAESYFEALLKVAPGEAVAHLALGEIRCAARRYSECLEHFEASAGAYLLDPKTILKFADAAIQTKQQSKAESALLRMPESAPGEQHLHAGLMLARMEKYGPAAREFQLAATGPDAYLAGYNLALALLKAKEYEAAVKASAHLMTRGFATAELYNVQAHAYEKSGRTKEAFEALRTAMQIDPGDETNYLDLIAVCLDHKNLDLALEIAKVGLKRLPRSERLQLQAGIVHAMRAEFEDARMVFATASAQAPQSGLPQVALGLVLLQLDKTDEAVAVLRKTTTSKDDRYLMQWFLAEAISRKSDTVSAEQEEAISALRNSIAYRPDLAQPRVLLGKLLLRRGEVDSAMEQLQRAVQLDPDNTVATYQLATAFRRKGDSARANELFAKVSKAKSQEREELMKKGLELITEGGR